MTMRTELQGWAEVDEEIDLATEKIVGDRGVAGEDDCGDGGGTADVAQRGGRWR